MTRAFVDTGFWYALAEPRDQHHEEAVRLVGVPHQWWTSDLVINEAMALWQRRGHLTTALEFLSHVRKQEGGQIVFMNTQLTSAGWEKFRAYGRLGATPVDAASFAIMRFLNVETVFGFDHHFQEAGFRLAASDDR